MVGRDVDSASQRIGHGAVTTRPEMELGTRPPVGPKGKNAADPAPLAFFIPGLNGGGAQRVFVTLVNTLVSMTDHPIHLVTSRQGGSFERLVDERVVRIVLGPQRVSRSILPLARYIRTQRPVAMVSTLDYCNVVFLIATMFAGVRLRKVVRDANVIRDRFNSPSERIKAGGLRFLMRLLYPLANDVIIITKDVERSLLRHRIASVGQMRRIPNPVVVNESPRVEPAEVDPPSDRFVLAIGRLCYQKGFDILIRAFAALPDREIKLVILGDGPLEHELKALASELRIANRVFLQGFVPNTAHFLRSASVFVLSSRWEGFSNALTEALAAGAPIVATDCPGSPREVLEDGRLGRLVRVENPTALANAITAELAQPSTTVAERRLAALRYESAKIAGAYLRVLTGETECSPRV